MGEGRVSIPNCSKTWCFSYCWWYYQGLWMPRSLPHWTLQFQIKAKVIRNVLINLIGWLEHLQPQFQFWLFYVRWFWLITLYIEIIEFVSSFNKVAFLGAISIEHQNIKMMSKFDVLKLQRSIKLFPLNKQNLVLWIVSRPDPEVNTWQSSRVLEWILVFRNPAKNSQGITLS